MLSPSALSDAHPEIMLSEFDSSGTEELEFLELSELGSSAFDESVIEGVAGSDTSCGVV